MKYRVICPQFQQLSHRDSDRSACHHVSLQRRLVTQSPPGFTNSWPTCIYNTDSPLSLSEVIQRTLTGDGQDTISVYWLLLTLHWNFPSQSISMCTLSLIKEGFTKNPVRNMYELAEWPQKRTLWSLDERCESSAQSLFIYLTKLKETIFIT